ncbi:MAG: hypothetical protein H6741_21025 [Alphaproteobacteria bacterium]|nr:hypothetical protein [Alphaproteobacteria bacterium]
MTLHARIAALPAPDRQHLIQAMQAPGHLISPPNAPGAVHAHELLAWASGAGRLEALEGHVATLESQDER